MNIFIDGHFLDGRKHGVAIYLDQLYHQYRLLKPDDQLYFGIEPYAIINYALFSMPNVHVMRYRFGGPLRFLYDIPRMARKVNADVIHTQYVAPFRFYSIIKRHVTLHDVLYEDFPEQFSPLYRWSRKIIFGWSARRAELISSISEYSRSRIATLYKRKPDDIHLVPPGVVDDENSEVMLADTPRENSILYVSRFEKRKNHIVLLRALVQLRPRHPGLKLILVGFEVDGMLAKVRAFIAEHRLDDAVEVHGNISDDELQRQYRTAGVVAYPSFGEGFGMPIIEAFLVNSHTLFSNSTAMAEFTFAPDNTFDPTDDAKITAMLDTALRSRAIEPPEWRAQRHEVIKKYNWRQSARTLADMYHSGTTKRQNDKSTKRHRFTKTKSSYSDTPMLHIVGIVGLPNGYGGFETLADHLLESPKLVNGGIKVYSERWLAEQQSGRYKGAELVALPWRANGWKSILYDTAGLWRASWQGGVVLVLGTSATFWLPLLRKLFPQTRYLVNMAGLEWARAKWGKVAKALLRYNEAAAARHAHVFIADNQGLVDYVRQTYGRESELIAYGGDQFINVVPDLSIFEEFELPQVFDFAMARAQIDNNMEMLLQSYASSGLPLVFVSNWDSTAYGREVRERYGAYRNLHLIGPIYNSPKVKALHSRTRCYVHGHSAGGTNPVLVEAMWAGLPTFAYDVNFNRHTTRGHAFYFGSAEELARLAANTEPTELNASGRALHETAQREYTWRMIREAYEDIILTEEPL